MTSDVTRRVPQRGRMWRGPIPAVVTAPPTWVPPFLVGRRTVQPPKSGQFWMWPPPGVTVTPGIRWAPPYITSRRLVARARPGRFYGVPRQQIPPPALTHPQRRLVPVAQRRGVIRLPVPQQPTAVRLVGRFISRGMRALIPSRRGRFLWTPSGGVVVVPTVIVPVTVTGSDQATTTVTGADTAAATVAGTDRATAGVTSTDRSATTVTGSDQPTSTVS